MGGKIIRLFFYEFSKFFEKIAIPLHLPALMAKVVVNR